MIFLLWLTNKQSDNIFQIRIGSVFQDETSINSWPLFAHFPGDYSTPMGLLTFNMTEAVCGRYVSLQRPDDRNHNLAIIEVEVMVKPTQG